MKNSDIYVVVIGSSAGGLESLQLLLPKLTPENTCYVICQHLSPKHKSMLVDILSRDTTMPVTEVKNGMSLEAGKMYVTPAGNNIEFDGRSAKLIKSENQIYAKPNINHCFVSVSQNFESRTIGIVLSGSGSDGALGLQAILASGGVAIAQSPESSAYDSMPNAAIEANMLDFVGSPDEIARYLDQVIKKDSEIVTNPKNQDIFKEIIDYFAKSSNIDFANYRKSTIIRRINRRMALKRIETPTDYFTYIKNNTEEVHAFVQNAFIHVSAFYRDVKAFDQLTRVLEKKLCSGNFPEFRIWVPGCSTGEEAYTLAMIVDDIIRNNKLNTAFKVFATDISKQAVAEARTASFGLDKSVDLPDKFKELYCQEDNSSLEVKPAIRDRVVFSVHNLLSDPPFSRVNLISCRNLLIYVNNIIQEDLSQLFNYALVPSGILFLGSAETLKTNSSFKVVDEQSKIYEKANESYQSPKLIRFKSVRTSNVALVPQKQQNFDYEIETYRALIKAMLLASLVINESNEIIFAVGDAKDFISDIQGFNSQSIISRIVPELRAEMRAILFRTRRSVNGKTHLTKELSIDGVSSTVRIEISHYHPDKPGWLLVCLLKHNEKQNNENTHSLRKDEGAVLELEEELTATRENLQTVIEELETANEQLNLYNEELQSSNEEYQSTNEELQTINEELHSTNEELVTVNDELKNKNYEQERLASDIFNIQESLDVPVFVLDMEFRIQRFTKRCSILADTSRIRIDDIIFSIQWHHSMPDLRETAATAISEQQVKEAEYAIGGSHFRCSFSPYINNSLERDGIVIAFYDITHIISAQRALAMEKDIAQMTLASLSEGVVRLDENYRVEYMNPAAENLLQWSANEVIGKNVQDYLKILDQDGDFQLIDSLDKTRTEGFRFAPKDTFYTLKTRYGEERLVELTLIPINSFSTEHSTVALITFKDVTERQSHLNQLLWSAKHDALTGLVNRKEMENRIQRSINHSHDSGGNSTLLYLDLDQFKVVNDTCGHLAGDQLLKQIAQLISNHIRSRDTLARLGGDEFSILLEQCPIFEAEKIANTILEEVTKYTFYWENKLFKIGVSIGVVLIDDCTEDVASVLSDADAACYAAKDQGRNRIQVHSKHNDMLELQRSQMSLVSDISDALENSGLRVYFQEISSIDEKTPNRWEALVRMFNQEGEFLLPSQFLTAAERYGVIKRIDLWVVRHVLNMMSSYFNGSDSPIININVSSHTISDNEYLNTVAKTVRELALPFNKLCFELTETAVMYNLVKTKEFIKNARDLGCLVALDDFGTGTSSLAYLKELSVDLVKIDGIFSHSIATDDVNHIIVQAVTNIAHCRDIAVVAEGLESQEQYQALRNIGVDFIQGYAIGRPIPLEEFVSRSQNRPIKGEAVDTPA